MDEAGTARFAGKHDEMHRAKALCFDRHASIPPRPKQPGCTVAVRPARR